MKDYQKSLDTLVNDIALSEFEDYSCFLEVDVKQNKNYKDLQELVDKEKAMKPYFYHTTRCDKCKSKVYDEDNYCSNCGQRLEFKNE